MRSLNVAHVSLKLVRCEDGVGCYTPSTASVNTLTKLRNNEPFCAIFRGARENFRNTQVSSLPKTHHYAVAQRLNGSPCVITTTTTIDT
jgi:hypothetical protein